MVTTTLSSKFQISIPKDLREREGWKPGQQFAFLPDGKGGYSLVPVPRLSDMRGVARGANTADYRDRTDRY